MQEPAAQLPVPAPSEPAAPAVPVEPRELVKGYARPCVEQRPAAPSCSAAIDRDARQQALLLAREGRDAFERGDREQAVQLLSASGEHCRLPIALHWLAEAEEALGRLPAAYDHFRLAATALEQERTAAHRDAAEPARAQAAARLAALSGQLGWLSIEVPALEATYVVLDGVRLCVAPEWHEFAVKTGAHDLQAEVEWTQALTPLEIVAGEHVDVKLVAPPSLVDGQAPP